MGLFNGIKNLLFEDVDQYGHPVKRAENKTATDKLPDDGMPIREASKGKTDAYSHAKVDGSEFKMTDNTDDSEEAQIDEVILDNIIAMLDEKNLPGPDYLELKKAANEEVMLKSIPDEKVRFSVSFAALKTASPSLTKQQILQSILTYIQYIEDERERGVDQFNKLWDEQVVAREEAIAKAKTEITELEEKLAKLKQFAQDQETQVVAVKEDCGKKKKEFNATVDFMIGKLRMDGAKLEDALND